MLRIMLVASLCCVYTCAVYSAMFDIETKLTQPRCDCPQCSILEKINQNKCGLAGSRILDLLRLTRKEKLVHLPSL